MTLVDKRDIELCEYLNNCLTEEWDVTLSPDTGITPHSHRLSWVTLWFWQEGNIWEGRALRKDDINYYIYLDRRPGPEGMNREIWVSSAKF